MKAEEFAKIYKRECDLTAQGGNLRLKNEVSQSIKDFMQPLLSKKSPSDTLHEAGMAIKSLVSNDLGIKIESIYMMAFMSKDRKGPKIEIVFKVGGRDYPTRPKPHAISLPDISEIAGLHRSMCWVIDSRSPFFDESAASIMCSYVLSSFIKKAALNSPEFIMSISDDLKERLFEMSASR